MNAIQLHPHLSEKEFWEKALQEVVDAIHSVLQKKQSVVLGLAGGRTPKHLYENLADQKLPWEKLIFVVLDERCVPTTDPESNLGMMQNVLFSKHPESKVLAFNTNQAPHEAAEQMATELITLSNSHNPLFDLVILGAGKDGHIASLFEEDSALNALTYASEAQAKGYATEKRLTATLLALESSAKALLLLQGEEKRPVLTALKDGGTLKLTALHHLMSAMPLTVLTDLKP